MSHVLLCSLCFYLDRLTASLRLRAASLRQQTDSDLAQRGAVSQAYSERNRLACLLARRTLAAGGNAGTFIDVDAEPRFRVVVAFDLPTGQCTFHMDELDAERPWQHLPAYVGCWDGHTDAEKWRRVRDS